MNSPVGVLHLVSSGEALAAVVFENGWKRFLANEGWDVQDGTDNVIRTTERQLNEYFGGQRKEFDIPLLFSGTEFQNQAWRALTEIPFGKTFSYSEQAMKLKNPAAVRAVGAANGKNKICIVVPCHRVIGKDGSLTGFAGGTEVKKILLNLESSQRSLF
jgi:methylated-DNA-[protein]-cysteine S-methyltransferase